ncbi:MAG: carbohydrate ABC transporter permease [Clostridia bacterium]|nr:carbohydrate ABC transporter permease [Clostridia bacterium]
MAKNKNRIRMDRSSRIYTFIIYALVTVTTLVVAYPLYFAIVASFSDPNAVAMGDTVFWFKGFTLEPYQAIIKEPILLSGYRNSLIYMVFGTAYNMMLTIPAAYVLSKKNLPGRKSIMWYFLITMYVGGGLIPTYLWYKQLGLVNNPLVMIVGQGVSAYNMIVARQFFMTSIPDSLYEAAEIDGASEIKSFFRIALPLAKPIIAVITLYYAFAKWNSYYAALVYLRPQKYWPLQLALRQILITNESAFADMSDISNTDADFMLRKMYMVRAMKYAVIMVASVPMLVFYPFVQKYFTKGVMIGSVKE